MTQDWRLNKLVIPTILAFSVLIAGVFAFIPTQNVTTVHPSIIEAIQSASEDFPNAIILDLEDKIKLSSDIFTSGAISNGGDAIVTIRALDGGQPTTFNLKECYLTGTSNDDDEDDIEVTRITVDGEDLFTDPEKKFTSFGPWTDDNGGTAMVEVISGLGFHTGLGADDTITMTIRVDFDDRIDRVFCIAFVQQSADLQVTMSGPPGGD